jgi:Mg-chelatase subunit ChlD
MNELIKGQESISSISKELELIKNPPPPPDTSDTVFIVDCSGSMGSLVQGKPKIDHAREALKSANAVNIILFGVWNPEAHLYAKWGTIDDLCTPGSTPMDHGFKFLAMSGKKFKTIICVSDGEPNSKDSALSEAKKLGQRIESVYIGEPGDDGSRFMSSLCKETGGQSFDIDNNQVNFGGLISEKVTLLIGGKQESTIEL